MSSQRKQQRAHRAEVQRVRAEMLGVRRELEQAYNEFDNITETEVNGNTVTIKGSGDEFSLALWVSGDYSYSVSVSSGISEKALKEIIEKIK